MGPRGRGIRYSGLRLLRGRLGVAGVEQVVAAILAAETRGEGGVVVTIVADRSEIQLAPSQRMFVPNCGHIVGSLHESLDERLAAEARHRLDQRRSGMSSYRFSRGRVERVGVRGGDLDVFFEVLERRPKLVIVGAGHIAVPLAELARVLEYEVVIVDDRLQYANPERFPSADEIVVGDYRETLSHMHIDRETYIVLVTRGHVHDQASLEQVLRSPAAYIGMIGSRRRVGTVIERLRAGGHDSDRLKQVHAPIGLDIGARTPAEIATAVLAEIIKVRRGGRARSLSLSEAARD